MKLEARVLGLRCRGNLLGLRFVSEPGTDLPLKLKCTHILSQHTHVTHIISPIYSRLQRIRRACRRVRSTRCQKQSGRGLSPTSSTFRLNLVTNLLHSCPRTSDIVSLVHRLPVSSGRPAPQIRPRACSTSAVHHSTLPTSFRLC